MDQIAAMLHYALNHSLSPSLAPLPQFTIPFFFLSLCVNRSLDHCVTKFKANTQMLSSSGMHYCAIHLAESVFSSGLVDFFSPVIILFKWWMRRGWLPSECVWFNCDISGAWMCRNMENQVAFLSSNITLSGFANEKELLACVCEIWPCLEYKAWEKNKLLLCNCFSVEFMNLVNTVFIMLDKIDISFI